MKMTNEQLSAVENRSGPLLVSAAAGSGKTSVLVERLLGRVVNENKNVDDFLLITFTRAAAGEMRERIQTKLAKLIRDNPQNAHLKRQTVRIYSAHISTLHSYCQSLIKQYAPLCGIHPDSRLIVDTELKNLYASVLDTVLERLYAECPADSPFLSLAETLATAKSDRPLCELVLNVYEELQAQPNPLGWLADKVDAYVLEQGTDAAETVWGKLIIDYIKGQVEYARNLLIDAMSEAETDEKFAKAYAPALRQATGDASALLYTLGAGVDEVNQIPVNDRKCAVRRAHWDDICSLLDTITKPKFTAVRNADAELKARLVYARDEWVDILAECRKYIEGSSELLTEEVRRTRPVLMGLKTVIDAFHEALDFEKKRLKVLTHSDSEHLAASLLLERGEDGEHRPSGIARDEAARFAEVFADEYQDISPMQEILIRALTPEGNLFMVGDVRQSIYRFRLADPRYFLEKYNTYPDAQCAPLQGERRILLTKNFRSHPEILGAVNYVFSRIMSAEAGELDYTEKEYVESGKDPEPHMQKRAVELLLADPVRGSGEDTGTFEAAAVAKRLRQMIDEGFPVSDGAGGSRPVRAGDMAVLMRAPGPRLAVYREALEREGFSVQGENGGGEYFWASPEIQTALSLIQLIDNPMREIPLLAALRCPAYELSADALGKIRNAHPSGSFYDAVLSAAANGNETCSRLFEDMEALRGIAPELNAERLIARLYAKTGLLVHFGRLGKAGLGKVRQDRLRTFIGLARGNETIADFLKVIERLRESGKGFEVQQQDNNAVSILSVHKSKGLEYPVVAVCDLSKAFHRQSGFLRMHTDYGFGVMLHDWESFTKSDTLPYRAVSLCLKKEDLAEEMRILYVAMTRARERLILSCTATKADEKLEAANRHDGVVPPAAVLRAKSLADWVLAAGTPPEWEVTVCRDGVPSSSAQADDTGEHCSPLQTPALPIHAEEVGAARRVLEWVYPHAAAAELPSKLTVTGLKGRFLDEEANADTPRMALSQLSEKPKKVDGLTAAQRGSAQHLALQHLRLELCADADGVTAELDRLTAKRLLTPEQASAVNIPAIVGLINSDYGKRMLKAAPLHREFKFSLLWDIEELTGQPALGEEALFQGVVDCFWEENCGLVLLDFKTDHVIPGKEAEHAEIYRTQIDLYARALTRIIKKPVAEKVIYFLAAGKAVVM